MEARRKLEEHEKSVRGCFGRASPLCRGKASPLCRDSASQLNSLSKFVFVHMGGGPALLDGISLLTTRDLA